MKIYTLVNDCTPVLITPDPVKVLEYIMRANDRATEDGTRNFWDVYASEVE